MKGMDLFFTLFSKLLPVYFVMAAGFGLARMTGNIAGNIAILQIYLVAPIVVFTNVMNLNPTKTLAVSGVLMFLICCAVSCAVYFLTRHRKDGTGPVLAQSAGTGNTGYLGVPVAIAIFTDQILPAYLLIMVATVIYESTLGYYFIARGKFSPRQALLKLARLPMVYAAALGLLFAINHWDIPQTWQNAARDFRGFYVISGALIIGISLAQVKKWRFDAPFFGTILGVKFILWPLAALAALWLESQFFDAIPQEHRSIILLMSLLPLAANTAAFAALFDIHPDKAATAVAASTLIATVTLPVCAVLLGLV